MLGLGRISGLHKGKPIFWVSKSFDGVTRANREKGTREKTDHWIIHVEASGLDMMEVLGAGTAQAALPAPDPVEVRALEAPEVPAGTVTVGFMTGETGETTNADNTARTVGNELFAAGTVINGAVLRMNKTDALIAATSDKDRSIGILLAGTAITAGAGKRIGLLVSFTQ
jgi:hypothetical protein